MKHTGQVSSAIIFVSLTTSFRLLTFLLGSLTMMVTFLLFCTYLVSRPARKSYTKVTRTSRCHQNVCNNSFVPHTAGLGNSLLACYFNWFIVWIASRLELLQDSKLSQTRQCCKQWSSKHFKESCLFNLL